MLKGDIENVGVVTNRATAIESYKSNFEFGSKEWLELDYRVRACIAISQSSIDCAKGIKIDYGFPKSWILNKPNTIDESDSNEEKQRKEFYNKIVANKKPYFFIYVYDEVYKEYNKLLRSENKRCLRMFGKTLEEIMDNPVTQEEVDTVTYYKRKCPIDKSPSVVNKIAWYVEEYFKGLRFEKLTCNEYTSLLKTSLEYNEKMLEEARFVYKKYLNDVKNLNASLLTSRADSEERVVRRNETFEQVKHGLHKITNNEEQLCNLVVDLCYSEFKTSKHFAWTMSGKQIIRNLLEENGGYVEYPVMVQDEGEYDFVYKGYKFKMFRKRVDVNELYCQ